MAVLTAQGISRVAIELLSRMLTLPRTATMVPGEEFAGSNGDTITIRVPQPGAARTQASAGASITYDDVDEIAVDVALSHLYHAKRISDEELSLELEDFARQVTRVQVAAVATGAEDELAAVMNALSPDATIEFAASASGADTIAQILAAREFLGENDAPPSGRWFAVSPDIATRILSVPEFSRLDASGSTDALRNAQIGRLYGFEFVESNALDAGTAVAYHSSGFAFATRTPVRPRGAVESASVTAQGIGMRHLFQYDPDILSDASVLSTFCGAAAVYENVTGDDNQRFVKIGTGT